jgi:homopolymeric O-antigen transport system ATP-binding protein
MSDTVITVENLSKSYKIGRQRSKNDGLRHVLQDAALAPWRWLRKAAGSNGANGNGSSSLPAPRSLHPAPSSEEFWALRDVNLEVKQGEIVGIIGRNGAGKSTLLKILSRISEPTGGRITLKGRVASLLEVGTGFHPELTGRENIFLNGAILGMTRAEIKRKLDDIVAFSEIEKFLDTPAKRYSSGMYVRLAFAVAAHLEPEILIVDEVLAVGDAEFQRKCLGKMSEVAQGGRTVLFVSHNMAAVAKLCSGAILLEKGRALFSGACDKTIQQYIRKGSACENKIDFSRRQAEPYSMCIKDAYLIRNGVQTSEVFFGDEVQLLIEINVTSPARFSVELVLRDDNETPIAFSRSGLSQDLEFPSRPGEATIRCELPRLQLAQGTYSLDLILAQAGVRFYDYLESGLKFTVQEAAIGARNWSFRQSRGQGCLLWDVKYQMRPCIDFFLLYVMTIPAMQCMAQIPF